MLLSLFFSAFTSATLLPGSSEVLFLYMFAQQEWHTPLLILVAGIGNSLGGMTNWFLGVLIRLGLYKTSQTAINPKIKYQKFEQILQRFGAPILFFGFLPIIGDPLCLLAGLIKIHWFKALIFISTGKFFRYFLLTYLAYI